MEFWKLRYAIMHPRMAMRRIGLVALAAWEAVPPERAFRVLTGSDQLHDYDNVPVPFLRYNQGITEEESRFLYSLVRVLRPSRIVETGVSRGASSAAFLSALDANGFGRLTSIDTESSVGDFVPNRLRDRWDFLAGPSAVVLPRALNQLGEMDVFFHDSDHTFENMTREFEVAWPAIRNGGVLLSHDSNLNTALRSFARRVDGAEVVASSARYLGGIRKGL